MIIYKATNLINGKVYIGQTVKRLLQRKSAHLYNAKKDCTYYFHNAIRKYGTDNFKWEVICICPNIESLNEQEQYYIKLYNSMKVGYNLHSGGLNYTVSEKTRKKLRKAHPSMRGKNNPNYGKPMSEERKEKIRQATLGRIVSKETRRKKSISMTGENHWNYGKHHSDETKKRMSIANKKWRAEKKKKEHNYEQTDIVDKK